MGESGISNKIHGVSQHVPDKVNAIWDGGHQLISIYSSTPSHSLSNAKAYTSQNAISVLSYRGFPSVYARRCTRYGVVDISSYSTKLHPLLLIYLIQRHIHPKTLYKSCHLEDSPACTREGVHDMGWWTSAQIKLFFNPFTEFISYKCIFTPKPYISLVI